MSADSGWPLSICQASNRRHMYSLLVRYIRTIYVYVIITVFTFRQKKIHIYPDYT